VSLKMEPLLPKGILFKVCAFQYITDILVITLFSSVNFNNRQISDILHFQQRREVKGNI
jgi:hypothetical protein